MFWFFGQKACGILALQPGMEASLPALEGGVLPLDPQGSPNCRILVPETL